MIPYGLFGGAKMEENCPNCGAKGWDPKAKHPECDHCGYKIVETKKLDDITLMFCHDCGCTHSNVCGLHPIEHQEKVKI